MSVCLSVLLFPGTGGQLFSREEGGYERDAEADILSSGVRTRTSPDSRVEPGLGPFLGPFSRFLHTALSRWLGTLVLLLDTVMVFLGTVSLFLGTISGVRAAGR